MLFNRISLNTERRDRRQSRRTYIIFRVIGSKATQVCLTPEKRCINCDNMASSSLRRKLC
ncbi:hypothetical protein UPYG_G00045200 [Umbra pygmaea]|uniref:Uncharacterized protein n=1 Tax=Umbra pygmaea TaxID=75934 RepID=A0ABD0XR04_UMBPY